MKQRLSWRVTPGNCRILTILDAITLIQETILFKLGWRGIPAAAAAALLMLMIRIRVCRCRTTLIPKTMVLLQHRSVLVRVRSPCVIKRERPQIMCRWLDAWRGSRGCVPFVQQAFRVDFQEFEFQEFNLGQ